MHIVIKTLLDADRESHIYSETICFYYIMEICLNNSFAAHLVLRVAECFE